MKNVREWDETYLLNLPSGEFDWIEYKEARKLDFSLPGINRDVVLRELSKQISAFANSGGGTIVFGIENPKTGKPLKVDSEGGVSLNLGNGTREWLEDIIPTLVDFPLSKINVYELTAGDNESSQIAAGKGVFIIEIPSSEQAPHQALDNLYYARVGGKSKPINHRFVMDIIGRAKHPKLNMEITLLLAEESERAKYSGSDDIEISCYCRNNGAIYANFVNGWLYIPSKLISGGRREAVIDGVKYRRFYFENVHKDMVGWRDTYKNVNLGERSMPITGSEPMYITRFDPVLPGLRFHVATEELQFRTFEDIERFSEERIIWEIYADNAPKETGSFTIKELIHQRG